MNGEKQPQLPHLLPWRGSSKGKTKFCSPLRRVVDCSCQMEKDKIHKTDFLLSWCRGVVTLESVRSCGDSLSTYLKVSWAVNLQ